VASPTERADETRETLYHCLGRGDPWDVPADLLPPGSQLVTPEDIEAGWRVLTPEQAETVRHHIGYNVGTAEGRAEALALLAGVPGKDSNT